MESKQPEDLTNQVPDESTNLIFYADSNEDTEYVNRTKQADLEESTLSMGIQNSVDERTIVTHESVDENTTSAPNSETNSFEVFDETSITVGSPVEAQLPVFPEEKDADLQIEDYLDPDLELEKSRLQKVQMELVPGDFQSPSLGFSSPIATSIHESAQLSKSEPKKKNRFAKTALITVGIAAILYGALAAVLTRQT